MTHCPSCLHDCDALTLRLHGGVCPPCAAAGPVTKLSELPGSAEPPSPQASAEPGSSEVVQAIGPGDVVLHRPSGEQWTVAYADPARNDLGWFGWPEGIARLSDCELVEKATPEQRAQSIAAWAGKHGNDHRHGAVRRLYAAELGGADAVPRVAP